MNATHFGAGNIGRGFVGEILFLNGFTIDFIDVNDDLIEAINEKGEYIIELASKERAQKRVNNIRGINNHKEPERVIQSILKADIVTTAIGPKILPLIAKLIAKGIQKRRKTGVERPLDIIACENMLGGSTFLYNEVTKFLHEEDLTYVDQYIGFPNAAVDRIIPVQANNDLLTVQVEPYKEWIIAKKECKAKNIYLTGVDYVARLDPYIERKLFSVNTGHASVAYFGASLKYDTIQHAMKDREVLKQLKAVLEETSCLLIKKWGFDRREHETYIRTIIQRFENPYISDDIQRVIRTPIRKLGYNERFIAPIRQLAVYNLPYNSLVNIVAIILANRNSEDNESIELQELLKHNKIEDVVREVMNLQNQKLISEIKDAYLQLI